MPAHFLKEDSPELFQLELLSNKLITEHRKSLNLPTPQNRVDVGDMKQIIKAFNQSGYLIISKEALTEIMKLSEPGPAQTE